jgi:hypothetical protein
VLHSSKADEINHEEHEGHEEFVDEELQPWRAPARCVRREGLLHNRNLPEIPGIF